LLTRDYLIAENTESKSRSEWLHGKRKMREKGGTAFIRRMKKFVAES
jgi:hypothetical protein